MRARNGSTTSVVQRLKKLVSNKAIVTDDQEKKCLLDDKVELGSAVASQYLLTPSYVPLDEERGILDLDDSVTLKK